MAADSQLKIEILVDGAQLNTAMPQAAAVVDDAATSMAAAMIRAKTASVELNSQLNTLAKSGLVPTAEATEEVAAAMFEARSAATALAAAEEEAYGSTQKLASGANNARIAFGGLVQDIGVKGSRALGSFIAQSETLAPLMSAAFTGVAAIAFVEIISRIPDIIKKASESLMGWNAAAKEAYQFQLKLNETIADHRKELELDKIANAEAGLKGAARTAQEIQGIGEKIALLKKYQREQGTIAAQAERELNAVTVIPAHLAGRVMIQRQEIQVIKEGSDEWKERKKRIEEAQTNIERYQNQILKLQQVETPRTNALLNEQQTADAEKADKKLEELLDKDLHRADTDLKAKERLFHQETIAELNDAEKLAREKTKLAEFDAEITREFNRNIEQGEKKIDAKILADKKQILEEIVKAQEKYLKTQERLAKEAAKPWQEMFRSINSGMDSMIKGILQGTQSLTQAFSRLGTDLLVIMTEALAKILLKHIAHWIAVNVIEKSAALQSLATLITGNTAKLAANSATNVATVTSDSAVAGVAGFASAMQALPFPINVSVAPGVGAAAFAAGMAYAPIASAAGGWDMVPAGGALTMLHAKEMVLSAPIADAVRSGASGGAAGGGDMHVHFNVSAIDGKSVEQFFRDNSDKVAGALRIAQREFKI